MWCVACEGYVCFFHQKTHVYFKFEPSYFSIICFGTFIIKITVLISTIQIEKAYLDGVLEIQIKVARGLAYLDDYLCLKKCDSLFAKISANPGLFFIIYFHPFLKKITLSISTIQLKKAYLDVALEIEIRLARRFAYLDVT